VRFLIVSGKSTIEIHETETGRQIGPTLTKSAAQVVTAHFHPDGRSLVAACDNGEIQFWSLPEARPASKGPGHKNVIWTTRFSPDGRQLLTASRDRTAVLWEVESGRRIFELRHDQQVYNAAFSPDGSRIVTGDASRKAHVWNARTGKRLFSLPAHPGGVWYGEFSSDGRILLTGDDAGNARLWEAATGLPLGGWIHNGVSLKRTHLSPDGRMALSAAENGTIRLWPVVLASVPAPAWLPDLAEALAGHRLRDDGSPEPVLAERFQALNKSLGSLPDDDFYARWSRWFFVERMQPHPPEFK
jgi:WD40 repeat protein